MKFLLAGAFCVAIFGLQACSTTELSPPTSSGGMANLAPGAGDETLRVVAELPAPLAVMDGVAQPVAVSDMLEVTVFQVPDLSRTVQVDDAGNYVQPVGRNDLSRPRRVDVIGNPGDRSAHDGNVRHPVDRVSWIYHVPAFDDDVVRLAQGGRAIKQDQQTEKQKTTHW